MEKMTYELEFNNADIWLNERLELEHEELIVYAYPLMVDREDDPIEAFKPDCDGDWQGVNGFDLEDYEDELNEFTKTIEKYIRDSFTDQISEYIDDKIIRITDIDDQPLTHEQLDESVRWVTLEYYKHYSTTLSCRKFTNKTVPYIHFICYSPVRGSSYVLICELCNVHFLNGEH